jgi:hypothetical protein
MSLFVSPGEAINTLSDADSWAKRPGYAERFDAIKDLRSFYRDLEGGRTPGFKSVASICAPLEAVIRLTDPGFLKDKRRFYSWLDHNQAYCTYDRRKQSLNNKQLTFREGQPIT